MFHIQNWALDLHRFVKLVAPAGIEPACVTLKGCRAATAPRCQSGQDAFSRLTRLTRFRARAALTPMADSSASLRLARRALPPLRPQLTKSSRVNVRSM